MLTETHNITIRRFVDVLTMTPYNFSYYEPW